MQLHYNFVMLVEDQQSCICLLTLLFSQKKKEKKTTHFAVGSIVVNLWATYFFKDGKLIEFHLIWLDLWTLLERIAFYVPLFAQPFTFQAITI